MLNITTEDGPSWRAVRILGGRIMFLRWSAQMSALYMSTPHVKRAVFSLTGALWVWRGTVYMLYAPINRAQGAQS
jgi:hypothetical protein